MQRGRSRRKIQPAALAVALAFFTGAPSVTVPAYAEARLQENQDPPVTDPAPQKPPPPVWDARYHKPEEIDAFLKALAAAQTTLQVQPIELGRSAGRGTRCQSSSVKKGITGWSARSDASRT